MRAATLTAEVTATQRFLYQSRQLLDEANRANMGTIGGTLKLQTKTELVWSARRAPMGYCDRASNFSGAPLLPLDRRPWCMPLPENEVKEELSYAYIHTIAARVGFSCDRPKKDFQSMDVQVNSEGRVCADALQIQTHLGLQLKATAQEVPDDDPIAYSLPIKNYNDLRVMNAIPRLLVLFVLPPDAGQWLQHEIGEHLITRRCAYYLNLYGFPEVPNETNKTVYIPRRNILTVDTLRTLMEQASRLELQPR
jgi:hypothetical protein